MKRSLGAAITLLLAGCLNTEPTSIILDFDLGVVGENWTPGVVNVPVDRLTDVALVGELRNLPAPLATTRTGLYLAGTNVTGDMFIYLQKRFNGLSANTTFTAMLTVEFATNIHNGCTTGIGASTFIKAGVSLLELAPAPDGQGILRVIQDLGDHTNGGDFTRLGDIRNPSPGCPSPGTFTSRTTITQTQPVTLTTDVYGGFILFVGIDSSVLGRPEIYFMAIRLELALS
jgi:hypothetical protein